MRPLAAAALLVLVPFATTAGAQESAAPPPVPAEEQEEPSAAPRRHIQVLEHPYDISSFYRSSQSGGPLDFGYEREEASSRYPIAGFYRSRGAVPGGYSRFWTMGYGSARARGQGRGLIGAGRPRALGLNGDLCLFAPTFLAPVGPLTGVFFER
jgi:hypothetical protein